jgi:hypothetical protein
VVEAEAFIEELVAHGRRSSRCALLDVVPVHDVVLRPGADSVHGELGAVIGNDRAGLATAADSLARYEAPRDRGCRRSRPGTRALCVHDVEQTERTAAGELEGHESRAWRVVLASSRIGALAPTARRRVRRLRSSSSR